MGAVRDIIAASLREIGVLAAGDTASYDEANDALSALNRLIDQGAVERLQIYTTTRTEVALTANQAAYTVGPTIDVSISDGFDSSWVLNPPDWTLVKTGSAAFNNDTVVFNAGGHSAKGGGGVSGTATLYRDIVVSAGNTASVSLYLADNSAGEGSVRIQNLQTTHTLTSSGVWTADDTTNLFSGDASSLFVFNHLNFTIENANDVGADSCTLRISLIAGNTFFAWFDTFIFSSPGADIVIPRPVFLDHVSLIDTSITPNVEIPLIPLTEDDWAGIVQKDITSPWPRSWYYNPTFPFGTLTVWPVPTSTTASLALYVPTQVSTFQSLSDTFSMPPGYERMYVKNLALEMCPAYNKEPNPLLVKQAAESMAAVKRANRRIADLSFPAGSLIGNGGRWYDIRSDQ